MYCLKCRRVTETENITNATSKNEVSSMHHMNPYIKMYCLKCPRVTETENITNGTSKNGRLMWCRQCIT